MSLGLVTVLEYVMLCILCDRMGIYFVWEIDKIDMSVKTGRDSADQIFFIMNLTFYITSFD